MPDSSGAADSTGTSIRRAARADTAHDAVKPTLAARPLLPDSLRWRGFFDSPTGALMRSVAFPGWGQWSNGKKQKAAVYFAIESYFGVKALVWRHRARARDDYSTLLHARDRRNYFYWLTGITVFVSMFDAYADRYLLILEKTQSRGAGYWGGQAFRRQSEPSEEWRLAVALSF